MRDYEVVYILRPSLAEEEATRKLENLHGLVTRSEGSQVVAIDHWGPRQLAYQITGETQGYYVVAQFRAEPGDLGEFERILKLDDEVLRYLVVLSEGEPTSGMSIVAESRTDAGQPEAGGDKGRGEEASGDRDEGGGREEGAGGPSRGASSPPEFSGGRGRRRRIDGPRIELLNYKDVGTLSRFITEQGKILPKRTTKVTAQFQRRLGRAVKRARFLALLPYIQNHDR